MENVILHVLGGFELEISPTKIGSSSSSSSSTSFTLFCHGSSSSSSHSINNSAILRLDRKKQQQIFSTFVGQMLYCEQKWLHLTIIPRLWSPPTTFNTGSAWPDLEYM